MLSLRVRPEQHHKHQKPTEEEVPLRVRHGQHHKHQKPTEKQMPLRVRQWQHHKHEQKRIQSPVRIKRKDAVSYPAYA